MNCKNCGTHLDGDVKFCQMCGNPVVESVPLEAINVDRFYESDIIMNAIVRSGIDYYRDMFKKIVTNEGKGTHATFWKSTKAVKKVIKSRKLEKEFKGWTIYRNLETGGMIIIVIGILTQIIQIYAFGGFVLMAGIIVAIWFGVGFRNNFHKIYYNKIRNFIIENSVTEANINTPEIQEKIKKTF